MVLGASKSTVGFGSGQGRLAKRRMDGHRPPRRTVQTAGRGFVETANGASRAVSALPPASVTISAPRGDVPFPAFAQRDQCIKPALTHHLPADRPARDGARVSARVLPLPNAAFPSQRFGFASTVRLDRWAMSETGNPVGRSAVAPAPQPPHRAVQHGQKHHRCREIFPFPR